MNYVEQLNQLLERAQAIEEMKSPEVNMWTLNRIAPAPLSKTETVRLARISGMKEHILHLLHIGAQATDPVMMRLYKDLELEMHEFESKLLN